MDLADAFCTLFLSSIDKYKLLNSKLKNSHDDYYKFLMISLINFS